MKIAINGSGQLARPTVGGLVAHIAEAAADGFTTYWLAQSGLVDALTVFVAAAPHAPGMELGTAVVPTYPRHPTALAGQALTAQAAVTQTAGGGRVTLGIGLSHKPAVEGRWGLRFERPVRHLLDYLDILQPLLNEGKAAHQGELWTGITEAARPTDNPPSVLLAALGPQFLKICGARTDGTLLWMVGPKTIADHIAPIMNDAAAAAGRPTPRLVCSLPVVVTDDPDGARRRAAAAFQLYGELPSYRAMLDREGAAGPADVTIIGDEASVRDQIKEIDHAGATEFSAVEFVANPDEVARTRALLKEINAS